jgi:hypothetical protein
VKSLPQLEQRLAQMNRTTKITPMIMARIGLSAILISFPQKKIKLSLHKYITV